MKIPTCTFSFGGLRPPYYVHVGFSFIPQGNEKINNQFLNEFLNKARNIFNNTPSQSQSMPL